MAMLDEILDAIDARTLDRDGLQHFVLSWLFLIEVRCDAREAREAFLYESPSRLDEALRRFAPTFCNGSDTGQCLTIYQSMI